MALRTLARLVIASSCFVAASASAQMSDEARGRQHHEAGLSYYDQARFEDAAREFRSAYRLSGRPHLLLNVAAAHEAAGNTAEAVTALEEYLQAAPDAEDRRTIEERLTQLRASLPADAPPDSPPDDAPPSGSSANYLAPVLVLAAAAAIELVAIGLGVAAHSKFGDLEEQCPDRVCPPALADDISSGETLATTSTVLTFAGAAVGIVGVILLAVEAGSGEDDPAATALGPGPGELGLSVRGAL